jgi:HSP20 family molecular chaperone IbpA
MSRSPPTRQNETETLTPSQPLASVQPPTQFVGVPGAVPFGALPYANTPQGLVPISQVPYANLGALPLTPAALQAFQHLPFGPFTAPAYPPVALGVHQAFPVHQTVAQPANLNIPAAIQDLGREIVATFELPGIAASDLQVVVGTSSIVIQGQRPAANGRVYQGTFPLPAEVLPSQANARLENGLLVVTAQRRTPTEEPRRVNIDQ